MIVVGYRLWWIRRPPQAAWDPAHYADAGVVVAGLACPKLTLGLAFDAGLAMPLMEPACCCSLVIDYLRWRAATVMLDDEVQRLAKTYGVLMTTVTRRFSARPAAVSLLAIGIFAKAAGR